MESLATRSLEQTESYAFFKQMKSNKVPSELAIAKALREGIGEKDELLDGQLNIIRGLRF